MTSAGWLTVLFAVVWAVTFLPAWRIFLLLVAESVSPKQNTAKLWGLLALYRLLIAAPYVVVVIAGKDTMPAFLTTFIVGIIGIGIALSIFRFIWRDYYESVLWNVYSTAYDGLLHFGPYRSLIGKIVDVSRQEFPHATSIVELGCGTGNVLSLLRQSFPNATIVGVDGALNMIRQSRRKRIERINYIHTDMVEYLSSIPDTSVDLVVMQNSLYALVDRDEFWKQLQRTLRRGGGAVISNPDRPGNLSIIREHLQHNSFWSLLRPRLVTVFVVDSLISQLSKTGNFEFVSQEKILSELPLSLQFTFVQRVYGGVDIMFILKKQSHE